MERGLDALANAWTSYGKGLTTLDGIAQPIWRHLIEGRKPEGVRSIGERAFWRRVNQTLLPTKVSFARVLDTWRVRMMVALLNEWDLRYACVRRRTKFTIYA